MYTIVECFQSRGVERTVKTVIIDYREAMHTFKTVRVRPWGCAFLCDSMGRMLLYRGA